MAYQYTFNPFTAKFDIVQDVSGFATLALDNLASVAINTSLLPASDNAIDLGSVSKNWRSLYLSTSLKNGATTLATVTELSYLTGVTSAIQTQINTKAPTASPTFTGTVTIPTPFTLGAVSVTTTGTELNYVVGVTSAIQTQLNGKASTGSITTSGLTQNTARLLGRTTAAAGAIEEITVGTGLSLSASSITNAGVTSITGTANQVIASASTGAVTLSTPQDIGTGSSPTFSALTLTNPLTVANGGTGRGTATAYAVLTGGTTSTGAHQSVASVGTAGQKLTSNGAASLPTFQDNVGDALAPAGNVTVISNYGEIVPRSFTIALGNKLTIQLNARFRIL